MFILQPCCELGNQVLVSGLDREAGKPFFSKPERFSCNVCCCVVEARVSAALTRGCSLLRRELNSQLEASSHG